jgi:hypothetical protein
MVLVSENASLIKEVDLNISIIEIINDLQTVGVNCAAYVDLGKDIPTDIALKLIDFYEYVVENSFDGLSSLLVRFFFRDGHFYSCIDTVCSLDLTKLGTEQISVYESDENCYTLSVKVKGDDVR